MVKFIFEPMIPADIASTLMGWGIPCNEQQLAAPTQKFVESVYLNCLDQLTKLSADELHPYVQAAMENVGITDHDLFLDQAAYNLLVYHLGRVAKAARLETFSTKDLTQPKPARTRDILSAFINFIKFAQVNCSPFIDSVQLRSRETIIERDEAVRKIDERRRQIKEIKDRMAVDEPRCDALRRENDVLLKKMLKMKEEQRVRTEEFEAAKMEKHAVLNRKENFNLEYNRVESLLNETKSRLVQSPDRIKRTIGILSTRTQEEKSNVASKEAKARELQNKISVLGKIDQDVKSLIEQLRGIEREYLMLDDSKKEVTDLDSQLDNTVIHSEELQEKQKRAERQLSNAHEKLERAQKHAEDKRIASQRAIERLQSEYDSMSVERRDNDKQMEELRAEAHKIETQMAEHLKSSEAETSELLRAYWALRHETGIYMETLSNKLSMKIRKN